MALRGGTSGGEKSFASVGEKVLQGLGLRFIGQRGETVVGAGSPASMAIKAIMATDAAVSGA